MTLRDLFVFLYKWKRLLGGMTLTVIILVTVFAYMTTPAYTSQTKIVVESNRSPTMRDIVAPTSGLAELLTTEAEMVVSHTVLSRVVDELKPQERPHQQSFIDAVSDTLVTLGLTNRVEPRDKWILRLGKNVRAKPIANSGVLNISYSDADPEWSAKIINAVTREYIQHHLAVFEPKGGSQLLKEQIAVVSQELENNRKLLRDYNQQGAITALNEQRQELVKSNLALKESLIKANNELDELRSRYAPGHKMVQLAGQRVERLEYTIKQQQAELMRLARGDSDASALHDAVSIGETQLANLGARYNEAMAHEETSVEMLNVRVIDYAELPKKPNSSRLETILTAALLGFFLSVAFALLFEYFDHRVDDQDLARDILGIPSLGYVPELPRSKIDQAWDN